MRITTAASGCAGAIAPRRLDAVDLGHLQVHQHHVRRRARRRRATRLRAVRRRCRPPRRPRRSPISCPRPGAHHARGRRHTTTRITRGTSSSHHASPRRARIAPRAARRASAARSSSSARPTWPSVAAPARASRRRSRAPSSRTASRAAAVGRATRTLTRAARPRGPPTLRSASCGGAVEQLLGVAASARSARHLERRRRRPRARSGAGQVARARRRGPRRAGRPG